MRDLKTVHSTIATASNIDKFAISTKRLQTRFGQTKQDPSNPPNPVLLAPTRELLGRRVPLKFDREGADLLRGTTTAIVPTKLATTMLTLQTQIAS
jgi:hypothetical protein